MQYTSPVPVFVQPSHQPPPPILVRPRPRFCILRPGGFWTPLIPLDELPSWLEVCNWTPDLYMGMYPASMTFIPREGEYDILCHHCSHRVDSLHQSVSERGPSSVAASHTPSTKDCPEPHFSPNAYHSDAVSLPTVLHHGSTERFLEQPPFNAMLQTPFVGMCVVDMNSQYPDISQDPAGPKRRMSIENSIPPPIFGAVGIGSPPLSVANSGNTRRSDSPYPHAHDPGSFGKPKRVASLRNESVASMQSGSVASTRSLTVAAIEQMRRMQRRRLCRGSSLHASISVAEATNLSQVSSSKISKVSNVSKLSKFAAIRVISKHPNRKVILRRRRVEERKSRKPQSGVSVETLKAKPEQPNSATKRRDRRERMMQRRKQSDRGKQPYRNMMRIPNWSPGMCKH
ncbi:hypothetical protein N7491_010521 [Penicillium cf. griseofulvum]|uniref:Uncharacterized protein n=1 Tax=Penicillium cf. griseofulvum TaxID=2972120 RepID=A0A9W9N0W5_9EURO|nr:hypothetical protein N7472_000852 [Penicillium cf. griseofulvum]KAJ5422076.1 hypothetical protein N7491_010521 [Penicillium cf. griseofulvum]